MLAEAFQLFSETFFDTCLPHLRCFPRVIFRATVIFHPNAYTQFQRLFFSQQTLAIYYQILNKIVWYFFYNV